MDTTSSTSSIVSALGGGSGIDMVGLAARLAAAQFDGRIAQLDGKSTQADQQISLASALKNKLLTFASALGDRVRAGDLAALPSVANPAIASATRPLGTVTASGSYSLEVLMLASRQAIASPLASSPTAPTGSGTLTIRFGTVGTSFAEDSAHAPVTITVPTSATLADVATSINASASGISAYVATGVDGARLVIKGAEGSANGFIIEASEDASAPGLAALAWSPGAAADRLLGTAADARFKLDGLERTSASNSIANAAPGVSLTLTATNVGAPTTIRFSDPAVAIGSAMQDLTAALNEIVTDLNQALDPRTGDLSRDPGARALRSALSQLGGTDLFGSSGSAPRSLAELGLATNRDGSFRFERSVLDRAVAGGGAQVAALFTPGVQGVFATIDRIARNAAMVGDPGTLGGSVARYSALKTRLVTDRTKLNEQMVALKARLTRQFVNADSRVGASHSTLSFLQNQIAAWNGKGQ